LLAEIETGVDTLLNDPANPADPEDIDTFVAEKIKAFAIGPDGKMRDFGSEKAKQTVADLLKGTGQRMLTKAHEVIRKQVETRSINTSTENYATAWTRGETPDVEDYIKTLVPGADLAVAKGAFMDAAVSYAEMLVPDDAQEAAALGVPGVQANIARAKLALDTLISSKRKDGFASFSPDEIAKLRDQRARIASQAEGLENNVRRKVQDQATDALRDRLNGIGSYPSRAEIIAARQADGISSEQADALLGVIEHDAKAARAEANGRSSDDDDSASGGGPSEMPCWRTSTREAHRRLRLRIRSSKPQRRVSSAAVRVARKMTAVIEELSKIEQGRTAGTDSREFRTAISPLTSTIDELSRLSMRAAAPSIRNRGEAWLKLNGAQAVTIVGKRYIQNGADPAKISDAVGRELIRRFRAANPGIKLR
jgi:hypothetical protein